MLQPVQSTAIVRQRGQLTIPDSIREITDWAQPGSVVSICRNKPDEIVIKPQFKAKKQTDWDKLLRNMQLARSFKGKYKGSLSDFIFEDRKNH